MLIDLDQLLDTPTNNADKSMCVYAAATDWCGAYSWAGGSTCKLLKNEDDAVHTTSTAAGDRCFTLTDGSAGVK